MESRLVRFSILMAMVLGAVAGATAQEPRITAREVVAEIQKQVGVKWQKDTVDTFKAGNPDTPVTGIAVTRWRRWMFSNVRRQRDLIL